MELKKKKKIKKMIETKKIAIKRMRIKFDKKKLTESNNQ
jgi:hypothetical protein